MLYEQALNDELAIMDEALKHNTKRLSPHEIQAPLGSLMCAPITIDIGASVKAAIDLLIEHKVGTVLVVSDGILRGIFGERDVLLKLMNQPVDDLSGISVEQFMKANPKTLTTTDSIDTAILEMAKGGYRHIPIVDERHRPVGLVSIRDIIAHIVEHFLEEVLTLPPKPIRDAMKAREGA